MPPDDRIDAMELWRESGGDIRPPPPPRPLPWKKMVIVLAVLLAGAAAWYGFRPIPPAEKIRRQLDNLAETVGKRSGEGNAVMAAKALRLQDLFAEQVSLQSSEGFLAGEYTADELARTITQGRAQFASISLDTADVDITLTGADEAVITFVGTVRLTGNEGTGTVERRPITATVTRDKEGRWRFASFKEEAILER